jgi:hypothetical protein
MSKLSIPNNSSLENSNSFNYPHIEIGDHQEKLKKVKVMIPKFGFKHLKKMIKTTLMKRLN